ncbi:MAG: zinc-binding dehydrogenase [Bacteroidota bacterium]
MTQCRSYQLKAGSLANMQLKTETLAPPAPNEVQVAVKAIGLNFADIFAIWGLYGATPKGVFVPGLEYAGEVVAIGAQVDRVAVGDRIMGVTRFGAYTTHLNIDQRYAQRLPTDWSFEEGAAYLVQVLTAYYALKPLGNLQEGQTVLIHSGGGGVGIQANRIAKKYNAFTVGTIGSSAKADFLKSEGYDAVIVRSKQFAKDLDEALEGRSLDIVLECIGGKIFEASYERMEEQGRMIVYGSARYASPGQRPNYLRLLYYYLTRPRLDPQRMIEQNKSVMGFNLIWLYHKADLMQQLLGELEALEMPKPHVGHTFEFEELKDAILLFQTGKTIGKVVVKVS